MIQLQLDEMAPWKQRYKTAQYWGLQVSQYSTLRGVVISNQTGENWIYFWDLESNQKTPLLKQTVSMAFFALSPDGQYIYYLKDESGSDLGHVVRLLVTGKEEVLTPDLPLYATFNVFFSSSGNSVGFTTSGRDGYRTYFIQTDRAGNFRQRKTIYESQNLSAGPWLSQDGKLALMATNKFSGDMNFGLVVLDTSTGEILAELWDGPGSNLWLPIRNPFSPNPGKYDLLIKSTHTGVSRPGIWNPLDNSRVDLPVEKSSGDVSPLSWSPGGNQILLVQEKQLLSNYYLYDLLKNEMNQLPLTPGIYSDFQFAKNKLFAVWENPSHASQIIEINLDSGKVSPILASKGICISRDWEYVIFQSADGLEIQAWLALPEGEGPFPTILNLPEGGITKTGFNPESQMWLDHGFAYMSVNHRGFRSDFAHQGEVRSLDDILAARDWLMEHNIAYPGEIFLTGGSEGGYLTLLALGLYPDDWAGGTVWGPIADWTTLYEDAGESRELVTAFFKCSPEENPTVYKKCSPITYVDRVKAPVQIFIGCNDNHVTVRQVAGYCQRLIALGKYIELNQYEGGHEEPNGNIQKKIEYQEKRLQFVFKALEQSREDLLNS